MKKKIIVLIILSVFIITGCNENKVQEKKNEGIEQEELNENSNSFNWMYDAEKLPEKEISLNNTNIKESLKKYGNHSLQVLDFKDSIIYGDYLNMNINNTVMETKGLFDYNITTKKLNYYEYNGKKRIWKYVFKDSYIYYIELSENQDGYDWEFKKATKTFSNIKTLAKGRVDIPIDAPFFISYNSKEIYIVIINDNKENNIETTKIIRVKNDELEELVVLEGNHKKKSGKFLQSPFSTIKIKDNKIVYTIVSYYDKEITYEMNLDTKETKEIFTNKELDDWSLSEIAKTDNYYLLNYRGKGTKGKLIVLNNNLESTQIECNGNKIVKVLDDETIIIKLEDYYLALSLKDKKFIYKYKLKASDYYPSYFIENNVIVFTTIDGKEEIKYAFLK